MFAQSVTSEKPASTNKRQVQGPSSRPSSICVVIDRDSAQLGDWRREVGDRITDIFKGQLLLRRQDLGDMAWSITYLSPSQFLSPILLKN